MLGCQWKLMLCLKMERKSLKRIFKTTSKAKNNKQINKKVYAQVLI